MIPVELILIGLSPVFLCCIALEWWFSLKQGRTLYQWRDSVANVGLALMHQAGDALALLLLMPFFYWLSQYAWYQLPFNGSNLLLLFLLQDFLYYWFHRASHQIRWLWASHVAHHSSRLMNFSTAFRQSLTYPLSGMWLFWTPLILLGFDVQLVLAVVAINLAFQFFVHTQYGKHWGFLGYLLNTPAWHRVHHACNPVYIDKNYAGVLVVWDRIFGTFEPEHPAEPCRYGITDAFESVNPVTITFYEWRNMLKDWRQSQGWYQRVQQLFGAPAASLSALRGKQQRGQHD